MPYQHSKRRPVVSDESTFEGAQILAEAVENYWKKRGAIVRTEVYLAVKKKECRQNREVWGVRSDLLNGLPRARAVR